VISHSWVAERNAAGEKEGRHATDMACMLGRVFRDQEAREERQRMRRDYGVSYEDDGMGSFDDGDPYTTNLYVGNLAPTVDEDVSAFFVCQS